MVFSPEQLLAVLIRAVLRESSEEASASLISEAVIALRRLLADSSPVVLKAVCESLRICLPSLASSSQPHLGEFALPAVLIQRVPSLSC